MEFNPEFTIGEYFLSSTRDHLLLNFIRHSSGRTFTYEDTLIQVAKTVKLFDRYGITKGDRVICYWEEMIPAIHFTLACALTGVVFIPLSPLFSVHYLKNLFTQSESKAVFTTADRIGVLQEGDVEPIGYPDLAITFRTDQSTPLDEIPDLSADEALQLLKSKVAHVRPEDIFMIQPTSGSTGQPKLVVRNQISPLRYARYVGHEIQHPEKERPRFLMVAALTHALGFHMLATALSRGAELLVTSRIDAGASLQEVRTLDPTVLPMTPRVLRSFYLQHQRLKQTRESDPLFFGPHARFLLTAGGSSDPTLVGLLEEQKIQVLEFYGASETSIMALTPRGKRRRGFAGKVLPDVSLKVAEDGELLIRSPGQMLGYFHNEKLTREAYDREGFYRTGDLGDVDTDGYVQILGRKKDVFNTPEGSNIYPERIEILLEALPWVKQAILIGDRQSYIAVLIVVDAKSLPKTKPSNEQSDYIDEHQFPELYQRAGQDLKQVNSQVERIEQVVRFALLRNPFSPDLYKTVGPGKVYRNRPLVLDTYANRVAALYHPTKVLDTTFVPGVDRRLRPHSNLRAHLIWVPRTTEQRLLGELGERLRDILKEICAELQIEIITGELHPDHIHLFLSYPPDLSVTEMIQKLKRKSSYRMLQEVPDLRNQHVGKGLWSHGYLVVSSGSINDEVIHKYLQEQESHATPRPSGTVLSS